MLKWLAGSSTSLSNDRHRPHRPRRHRSTTETVTDDPLAAIRVPKVDRPLEIYAVSRLVVSPGFYLLINSRYLNSQTVMT